MFIWPLSKIEKACAVETDAPKEILKHVYFDGKRLLAADGKIAAIIPVTPDYGDTSTPGVIPRDLIERAQKDSAWAKNRARRRFEVDAREKDASYYCIQNGKSGHAERPAFDYPYPNIDQIVTCATRTAVTTTIALDAQLLHRLAEALCDKNTESEALPVLLEIHAPNDEGTIPPITVKPAGGKTDRIGLLMPLKPNIRQR